MRVLLVGNGGREHALAWALQRSDLVSEMYFTGENAGIEQYATSIPLAPTDIDELAVWAEQQRIDLTVVGPEAPLAAGIVDRFQQAGLRIFGPSAKAAELEGSKVFAKNFMKRHGIPTAEYAVCESPEEALQVARDMGVPLVVKADGLAAGKGVTVCTTMEQAEQAIHEVMVEQRFGASGSKVVIEQCLFGEEASLLVLVDGKRFISLAPAQDHKTIYDGDVGPNTGGMGAYSPTPVLVESQVKEVERLIVEPVVQALAEEGREYRGILYVGLMMTQSGPQVIEFNCRFGDPETQAILPRLQSDLLRALQAAAEGDISDVQLTWDERACVSVVVASGGYPGDFDTGYPIQGLQEAANLVDGLVFHAGTKRKDNQVVTAGGRVLSVSALGDTIAEAQKLAYEAADKLSFPGLTRRNDIASKAL